MYYHLTAGSSFFSINSTTGVITNTAMISGDNRTTFFFLKVTAAGMYFKKLKESPLSGPAVNGSREIEFICFFNLDMSRMYGHHCAQLSLLTLT